MSGNFENKRRPKREGKLVAVAKIDSIPIGRGANVRLKDGSEIALFNIEGTYFAVENFCPHRGASIADSRTYGKEVECDLHGWRFDLATGECLTTPTCSIESYAVKIEDDLVKVFI
jgi:nitrite reductase/ring-hydroxylating ferredoxin subunit